MAVNCCICGEKIGGFGKPAQLVDGRDDYPICSGCGERKNYANMVNIPEENVQTRKRHESSVDFFVSVALAEGTSDDLREAIKSMPGVNEGTSNRVDEELRRKKMIESDDGSLIMTTGFDVCGKKIACYCGVITSTATMGTAVGEDALSALSAKSGETSEKISGCADAVKEKSLDLLRKKAILAGADAVIGVAVLLNNTRGASTIGDMVVASATGTAVRLVDLD